MSSYNEFNSKIIADRLTKTRQRRWQKRRSVHWKLINLSVAPQVSRIDIEGISDYCDCIFILFFRGQCGRKMDNNSWLTWDRLFTVPTGLLCKQHDNRGPFSLQILIETNNNFHLMIWGVPYVQRNNRLGNIDMELKSKYLTQSIRP